MTFARSRCSRVMFDFSLRNHSASGEVDILSRQLKNCFVSPLPEALNLSAAKLTMMPKYSYLVAVEPSKPCLGLPFESVPFGCTCIK